MAEAVVSFEAALSLDGSHVNAMYNRGVALQDLGEERRAADAYAETLQHAPMHADARLNYCGILASYGDLPPSERCLKVQSMLVTYCSV
jgi:Tfp pilus assembly protein PilF